MATSSTVYVNKILQHFELWHNNKEQQQNYKCNDNNRKSDDPGHGYIRLHNLQHSTDCKDWRIQNHTKQHNDQHLNLLDIIRTSRDQRCC